jgi:hypothetical protein
MSLSEVSIAQEEKAQRLPNGRWAPGWAGNPGGRAGHALESLTRLLDRVLERSPEETLQRLTALRDSENPIDRRTFWGLASRRIRTADSESGVPAGGIIIQVITGVPSQLPVVLPAQLVTPGTVGAGDAGRLLPQESAGEAGTGGDGAQALVSPPGTPSPGAVSVRKPQLGQ